MIELDEFERAVRKEERMLLSPNIHTGYLHANRIATERARQKIEDALAELPAPAELEEAIKHVTAYDSAQIGMLEHTKLWRLVVAARHYVWMLQRVEQLQAKAKGTASNPNT